MTRLLHCKTLLNEKLLWQKQWNEYVVWCDPLNVNSACWQWRNSKRHLIKHLDTRITVIKAYRLIEWRYSNSKNSNSSRPCKCIPIDINALLHPIQTTIFPLHARTPLNTKHHKIYNAFAFSSILHDVIVQMKRYTFFIMGCFVIAIYWLVKLAFLFSAKAAMPSFWSAYKTCISASILLCVRVSPFIH